MASQKQFGVFNLIISMFYTYYFNLKFIVLLWQLGAINALTAVQLISNVGSQWAGISGSALTELSSIKQLPNVLVEPLRGLYTSCRWIKHAPDMASRYQRITTMAAFLSGSGAAATMSSSTANAAYGTAIYAHITHMRTALNARGGGSLLKIQEILGSEIIKLKNLTDYNIVLHGQQTISKMELKNYLYRLEFTEQNKIIIQNMFHEHTLRRFRPVLPGFEETLRFLPISFFLPKLNQLKVLPLKVGSVVLWSSFAIWALSGTILGGLYLFQNSKRRRWERENQKDEIVIDVNYSIMD